MDRRAILDATSPNAGRSANGALGVAERAVSRVGGLFERTQALGRKHRWISSLFGPPPDPASRLTPLRWIDLPALGEVTFRASALDTVGRARRITWARTVVAIRKGGWA